MKLTEIRNLTFNFLSKSALAITLVILVIIFYALFSSYAFILPSAAETTTFTSISPLLLFSSFTNILLILIGIKLLTKVSQKLTVITTLISFAAIGFFLIYNNPADIRADAFWTYRAALDVSNGANTSFLPPDGYMSVYPHQMSLMWFYYLGHQLWEGTKWVYYVNLVVSLLTNLMIWLLVKDLTINLPEASKRLSQNLAAVMPVLFLPNLFMLNFGYNQVLGLFSFVFGIFLLNKTFTTNAKYSSYCYFFSSIALLSAVLIRQNFMIGIIATVVLCFVFLLKEFKITRFTYALLLVVFSATLPSQVAYYSQAFLQAPHVSGFPTSVWIAMGLQDSKIDSIPGAGSSSRLGGWYSDYPSAVYRRANYDFSKTNVLAKQDVRNAIKNRWNSSDHGFSFFSTKVKSTWGEPTYQSLFAGYVREQKQQPTNAVLKFVYQNDSFTRVYTEFMRSVVAILIIFTSISIYKIIRSKVRLGDFSVLLVSVFLTGGFLFHLIWETKSLYAYPYVALLVIPASLAPVYLLRPKQPEQPTT